MRKILGVMVIVFVLMGCSGEDNSLKLSVTDAPVDNATNVIIQFSGVEIQPASGERLTFDFDPPRQIDLLALQGGESALLLDANMPAGHYNWIRVKVDAEPDVLDSYMVLNDDSNSTHSMSIPSGDQTGLKLVRGFDVPAGGVADFTIDFDLRKSVHDSLGSGEDYKLRPVLRIVDNTEVGSVVGVVNGDLLGGSTCNGGDAVYVFEGHDITPDDVDGIAADPITTATVALDVDTGEYTYRAAFLSAGEYTVALTCEAQDDNPEINDSLNFVRTANVVVSAGTETTQNFRE